eukprot:Phypoly_transcript_00784.p1 GENE.Phypoly_transcript_00784~~Phypoly_transcript_00784.p1  ORF type:complete len:1126 (+),score=166.43 Phypoly_transcript_00784:12-3389(+)
MLNDNKLLRVPPEIGRLHSLTELRLDSNELSAIPAEICNLASLTVLDISLNKILIFPPNLSHLTSLTKLDASNNKFAIFPASLPKSLTSIDVSHNMISGQVPPSSVVMNCLDLQEIKLDGNTIQLLPEEMGLLQKLEVFTASNNELITLPPSLGQCTSLRILEVENNRIDYLPPEVSTMKLESLKVGNNAFFNIPNSVVKKGPKAVIKYFEEFQQENRNCCKIKLMVVGQENVGKTTLLQALRNTTKMMGDHSIPLSTDGIDIATWKVKLDKVTKKKIEFSCWDFAGQEIYYNTHQFFLSKSAIYILVWNIARPETARLDFWLESIEGSGGGVVALVGTHLNDPICTQEFLDAQYANMEQNVLKKYPNIRFVCPIDAKKGTGVEELKKSLVQLAQTLPQFGKKMPASTIKLEEAIGKEAKKRDPPLMTWSDYKQLALTCSINDDEQLNTATQFLHNLGSLIHFPSRHSGLSDLVILKPQFLPNLMCTVVTTKSTLIKNGVLMHKDLSLVWKKYKPALYPQFILLLEKFGIMCRLQEEATNIRYATISGGSASAPSSPKAGGTSPRKYNTLTKSKSTPVTLGSSYATVRDTGGRRNSMPFSEKAQKASEAVLDADKSLIPLLLEHNPAIDKLVYDSQEPDAIGREFHFRIAVTPLFPRLIVSILLYSRLANRGGAKWNVLYGKDQMFVGRGGTFALTALEGERRVLSVLVWGKNKTRMLTLITQSITFLLGDCFPNYQFTVTVLCPHCLSSTEKNEPKSWPLLELEARLLKEGDMATVICEKFVKTHRTLEQRAHSLDGLAIQQTNLAFSGSLQFSGKTETKLLIRDMVPDLALNDVAKIHYDDVKIEKQIGEGAYGDVFKATYNSKPVAIKTLRLEAFDPETNSAFKEFVHEASFMGQMNCPQIVSLIGVSLKPLAMMQEFMDLGDLQKFLMNSPKLDLLTGVKIALDIARGCQFLHSRTPPCIHADLKSPNILLCRSETGEISAKLGDLGLSRSVFAPLNKRMVDNPRWLAPEILSNQEYNEMADVYSFAIILWEIVTTSSKAYQEPFLEFQTSFDTVLEAHIIQGVRPYIPLETPYELVNIIGECWENNYFERPSFDATTVVLRDYLKELYGKRGITKQLSKI